MEGNNCEASINQGWLSTVSRNLLTSCPEIVERLPKHFKHAQLFLQGSLFGIQYKVLEVTRQVFFLGSAKAIVLTNILESTALQ